MSISFFGLIVIVVAVIGVLSVVGALTGVGRAGHTGQGQAAARSNKRIGPFGYIAAGVAVVVVLGWTTAHVDTAKQLGSKHENAQNAQRSDAVSKPIVDDVGVIEVSEIDLPDWTKTAEKVVVEGKVPTVHFVAKSDQRATLERAKEDAIEKAGAILSSRWKDLYPDMLNKVGIPAKEFLEHSRLKEVIRTSIKNAGTVTEYKMYEFYVQFEDSPKVREPIARAWRATLVDVRTHAALLGAGALALILGTFSSVLRVFLAAPGYRKKPLFAAATLGMGTAALFLFA